MSRVLVHASAVAAVSLIVQAVCLVEGSHHVLFRTPVVDAAVYHQSAVDFAAGKPLADGAFWQPPLFPFLLGCFYRLVGPSVAAARIVLALMATASCVLVFLLGRSHFSSRAGLVAGIMAALYGPFVFFSTRLLPVGLAVLLILVSLNLWLGSFRRTGRLRWWLVGLTAGLATITVPNAAVMIVLACAGACATGLRQRRAATAWLSFGSVLVGAMIPIAVVAARNHRASGEWVLISTNGGINFFLGNNEQSDRTVAIRPGEPWKRFARQSHAAGARTRVEQSHYFFHRTVRYVADQPMGFARGLLRKTLRLVNGRETPRNVDPYVFRSFSTALGVLLWRAGPFSFPTGLVLPLAVVGLVTSLSKTGPDDRKRAQRLALAAFVALYGLSVVAFFVTSRYRLVMVMGLIVFAGAGLCRVWDELRFTLRRRAVDRARPPVESGSKRAVAVILFAVSVTVAGLPLTWPTDGVDFRSELEFEVGQALAQTGDLESAEAHLRAAMAERGAYAAASAWLGSVLIARDRSDEAEALLQEAIDKEPRAVEPRLVLAGLLKGRGQNDAAADVFRAVLDIDPTSPLAHEGLAELSHDRGDVPAAIEHWRAALRFGEHPGPVRIHLADALVETGAYAEAIALYRKGLPTMEPDAATLNRVAWLLATCPNVELRDCETAIRLAQRACEMTGYRHAVALDTLAAANAECRQWASAVRWVRQAVEIARQDRDEAAAESMEARLRLYEARRSRAGAVRPGPVRPPP